MKILWVKTDFLHPTRGGGQIRTLEILKRLHRRHEIHYAALDLPQPGDGLSRAAEYCTKAYAVSHPAPARSGARYWADVARALGSGMPLAMQRYRSEQLARQVERLMHSEKFDAVVCDFLASAANIPALDAALLFQHNVESMIWKRHTEHAPNRWRRAYCRGQHERMVRYEGNACRTAKSIVTVSTGDAQNIRALYRANRITPIPTGVDVEYFTPARPLTLKRDLVFIGALDWRPNIDGLKWLVREVLPSVQARRPDCSLAIVGRSPTDEVRRLEGKSVEVIGDVEDVRPYLWESAVSVAPLRIGGGTRLKIYEAMAARVPVVSTSVGAEGLDVTAGENIAIADRPLEFAQACVDLLSDSQARHGMAAKAWEMVAACYSWETVARSFERILHDPLP